MKASWTTIDDDGRPVHFKRTPEFLRDFVCKTLHQVGMMDLVLLHVFRKGTKCIQGVTEISALMVIELIKRNRFSLCHFGEKPCVMA
jgi:hypothetical protein